MISYAASSSTADVRVLSALGWPNVLASYVFDSNCCFARFAPRRLFLDSGAFTVWTRGGAIPVDDYAFWARTQARVAEVSDLVVVANLDVIPGDPSGGANGEEELAAAVKGSAENAEAIRRAGLRVAEVYHYGEPLPVLEGILDRRRQGEMIAFGGLVGRGQSSPEKIRFVEEGFDAIRSRYGGGVVPVHGFGLGPDSKLTKAAPWYSIDSTSWLNPRKFGKGVDAEGVISHRSEQRVGTAELFRQWRRVFDRWRRLTASYTAEWEAAGVRLVEEPGHPLACL